MNEKIDANEKSICESIQNEEHAYKSLFVNKGIPIIQIAFLLLELAYDISHFLKFQNR